jgi:hypothetical protein
MYKHADSVLLIILRQGINHVAFEQPWSTIEKIESKPSDRGRSVIKSMDTYWNGPCSTCVLNLCRRFFVWKVGLGFLALGASLDVFFHKLSELGSFV